MHVTPYKTKKIQIGDDLLTILDTYLPPIEDGSIVSITSKIVSVCQGRVVKHDNAVDKHQLIRREADEYIEVPKSHAMGVTLTIKHDTLIANSGIDESNGNGYFVLWPRDLQETTNTIWSHLKKKHAVQNLGVIVTDSRVTPMRWGTLGVGLSWCGFEALHNYIGTPDIFGSTLRVTKSSVLDGLAAAAVIVMGEGNEQTPLAVIGDIPFVTFLDSPPTHENIEALRITKQDDIYAPLTDSPLWQKGGE